MEETVSPSNVPQQQGYFINNPLTPEVVAMLKERAKEAAIMQAIENQSAPIPQSQPKPNVVYVRRPLTVAEIILLLAIACGLVTGTQFLWGAISKNLPSIEVKLK